MTSSTIFAACGATVIGLGLFGLIRHADLLRRIVAFNVIGSGVFLLAGALGFRDPPGGADPVPHAIVITGIVVAVASTALAVALATRLLETTGRMKLPGEGEGEDDEPRAR